MKIRRKNVKWIIDKKIEPVNTKITLSDFIWNVILSNNKKKYFLLPQITHTFFSLKKYSNTIDIYKIYSYYLYNLYNLKKNYLTFINSDSLINFATISIPATQLFFTIVKKSTLIVFTCGTIRLVMQLLEKSSRKKKIVLLNSIKFLWNTIFIEFNKPIKIILKKAITIIKNLFEKKNKIPNISYIQYYPKLNFGYNNLKKRSSIKKKLRKKKKYSTE